MNDDDTQDDEILLTSEYLNRVIEAAQRGEADPKVTAMLARVILAETVIPRKDDAVARYLAGERSADIARDCGITEQTVTGWARSAGVRLRKRGRPPGAKDKTKRKVSNVNPRSND